VTQRTVDSAPGLCLLLAGLPGIGKRTIASALAGRLSSTGEVRLVDNHYIANPVLGVVEQDGLTPLPREVWERVADVRAAVLQAIERLAPAHWSFVFTADLPDDRESLNLVERLDSLASARGTHLVIVRLVCDLDELRRRIVDPARKALMKSVSERDAIERHAQGLATLEPWSPLTLDVTQLQPQEAAERILCFLTALSPDTVQA
jgi:energy-coupling factor transporter ATP-binding protein EcfA2